MRLPNRIHILDASGSGTSSLGSALASKHGHRHLDTYDFFWLPTDPPYRLKNLPEPLDDVTTFAYFSGWRKREILSLTWSDVDREGRRVTLRREFSKNREPRVLPLIGVLVEIIERRWRAREYKTKKKKETGLSAYVFHRAGRLLVDFRKKWKAACEAAGLEGLLFHDLRRSAVRNMDRAGVSQPVAMSITGHKTLSVYHRYRIVNEDDRREALERMQASLKSAPASNVTTIQEARDARQ